MLFETLIRFRHYDGISCLTMVENKEIAPVEEHETPAVVSYQHEPQTAPLKPFYPTVSRHIKFYWEDSTHEYCY